MSVTLQDLRNLFYGILREDESTGGSYPTSLADMMINTVELKICSGMIINPFTGQGVKKTKLPFLNTDKFYSNVPDTTLATATTVGATSLSVADTTNFPSSGVLFIGGNIITYTGKTSTTFTGCSNVLFAFTAGINVSIAYTLPTDYMNVINVVYNNKMYLLPKDYDDIYEDLMSNKGGVYNRWDTSTNYDQTIQRERFYTIKDGTYLIPYNVNDVAGIIRMRYEKKPTGMTATTDPTVIDNDLFAKGTIPYLAVGEILFNRGEELRAKELINFGLGQLRSMYDFYNNKEYQDINGTHYGIGKKWLNI